MLHHAISYRARLYSWIEFRLKTRTVYMMVENNLKFLLQQRDTFRKTSYKWLQNKHFLNYIVFCEFQCFYRISVFLRIKENQVYNEKKGCYPFFYPNSISENYHTSLLLPWMKLRTQDFNSFKIMCNSNTFITFFL